MSSKKIRKHKGINQITGRLKKGYKYSGKKLKNSLPQIIKINKKQNGGKVLGEGNYGCIITPAYSCQNTDNIHNKVSKLSQSQQKIDYDIYKSIRKIKNYDKFFIIPEESCIIESKHIHNNDKLDCKEIDLRQKLVLNQIMIKGDYDLYHMPTITSNKAITYFKHLLNCIRVLSINKIAHLDIKSINILIHNDKPYLIDFDDTFNPRNWIEFKIFLDSFDHLTDEYIWPPEVYYYFKKFRKSIPPEIKEYLNNLHFYKRFIDKVMVYSLGLAFKNVKHNIKNDPLKSKLYKELVSKMIEPNPYFRPTIAKCLLILRNL